MRLGKWQRGRLDAGRWVLTGNECSAKRVRDAGTSGTHVAKEKVASYDAIWGFSGLGKGGHVAMGTVHSPINIYLKPCGGTQKRYGMSC